MVTNNSNSIFPIGNKLGAEYFTGNAYLNALLARDKNNDFTIGSVTFEPNARTNWHSHPKGQVLLILEGKGLYQVKGEKSKIIQKGDLVIIPENTIHWHGATATTEMVHLAITNYEGEINVEWLEPVTNEEYKEANQ